MTNFIAYSLRNCALQVESVFVGYSSIVTHDCHCGKEEILSVIEFPDLLMIDIAVEWVGEQ